MIAPKNIRQFIAIILLGITLVHNSAHANKRAKKEEAVALVKRAIAEYKATGREKTFAAISDPQGKYRDRELFVVVLNSTGTVVAHPVHKKMIGASLMQFRDPDGVYMVKDMMDKAKIEGSGWSVEYKFVNPDTKRTEPKLSYFEKYDDLLFFCGIYKPK